MILKYINNKIQEKIKKLLTLFATRSNKAPRLSNGRFSLEYGSVFKPVFFN